jgi:predicted DCC family thiol-disulfide oxidoreductase YuxK
MNSAALGTPGLLLIYDGQCRFCVAGASRLAAMARRGTIQRIDLHDRAALARRPQAPQNPDASALLLVAPDGHVAAGAEAIALALGTRAGWRLVTWIYWLPVVRQVTDAMYRLVARNRYRIMGRVPDTGVCADGACRVDGSGPGRS